MDKTSYHTFWYQNTKHFVLEPATLIFLCQHRQSLESLLQAFNWPEREQVQSFSRPWPLMGGTSVGLVASSHSGQPGCVGKKRPPRKVHQDQGVHNLDPQNVARQLLSYYQGTLTRTVSCVILFSRIHFSNFGLRNKCSHEGSKCIYNLFQPEQITANHLFFVSAYKMHGNTG